MAKNITLLGASYSDVPAVNLPQTGGGTARFTDTSVTTAVESDVASGKIFIKADGSQATGTGSGGGGGGCDVTQDENGYIVLPEQGGGGGGSSYELLASTEITFSTTSTSSVTAGTITVPGLYSIFSDMSKYIYILIRDKAGSRTDYWYASYTFLLGSYRVLYSIRNSSGTLTPSVNNYGLYPDAGVNSTNVLTILARYSSSYSRTIDGTYVIEVYALDTPDGVSPC